jgi:hypothetical protein
MAHKYDLTITNCDIIIDKFISTRMQLVENVPFSTRQNVNLSLNDRNAISVVELVETKEMLK